MAVERYEAKILEALQCDGRLSNVEVAKRVGLSESPCLRKTKALEESKVIQGYKAVVDPKSVGCQISAVVLINLHQSEDNIAEFFSAVQTEPRVIECLVLTGTADIMLRVVARDIDDLTELTFNGLLRSPSVKDISSCIVLKEVKKDAPIPVLSK